MISVLMLVAALLAGTGQELRTASPDGRVEILVSAGGSGSPTYAVWYQGRAVISPSPLGLELDKGGRLGDGLRAARVQRRKGEDRYTLLAGKTKTVREPYNELVLDLEEPARDGVAGRKLQLVFRAYDSGAAFRYRIPAQKALEAVNILGESTRFDFAADYSCWGANLGKFGTSHEMEFDPLRASMLREQNLYDAPFVCQTGEGRVTFAITEADLSNYAGMYLQGRGDGGLGAQLKLSPRLDEPQVAVRTRIGSDVVSPWRVVMIASEPAKLIQSNLVTNLNPDPAADFDWVRPGKSAWDWWNGPTLAGVSRPGTNDETIKRFIDFASEAGLEYMMIDEGWYAGAGGGGTVRPGVDITRSIPEVNLPELVDYGRRRNVGLWLWLNWKALDAQMDEAMELYQKLGIKGIKVDFMDRDDQPMVQWYHRVLAKAAKHKLMVNFHGAYHPTGLSRTFPNYLTQEGVLGAEYNKWSRRVTARHNVTLAFTRLLAGPMDYTPGGFRNLRPEEFVIRNAPPNVQTTRAHGLAMYVVYESPFAVVADTPDAYRDAPGFDFIKQVPATWDETRAIGGEIGEYVIVARRRGGDWYVGAMNNETGREIEVPLDFLGPGRFELRSWIDGSNPAAVVADRRGIGARERMPLRLRLASTGGAALHFRAQ